MPTFKFGEDVYKLESLPNKLACEAELALGVDPMATKFGLLSVQLFVAMRQAHPEMPAGVIADKVNAADWMAVEVEEEEEESPLDEDGEEEEGSPPAAPEDHTALLTTGRQP